MKPWFDDEVIRAIEMKQRFNNKKSQSSASAQEEFIIAQYKYWRNYTTYIKRKKRREFNEKKFKQTNNNPAKQWKWVKNVLYNWESETDKYPIFKECKNINDKIIKANETNEYFCKLGESLAKNLPDHKVKMITP